MIAFIRSLDGIVSNAYDSGAMWTVSALRGTEVAPALPESCRSSSRTLMSVSGS